MPSARPTVIIEEVLDRARQGVTEPFICRGDDGLVYFVKGRSAGRRSLVCEWVSAQLATAFGLPVARYVLAEVPQPLVAFKARADIHDLGSGVVFASGQVAHAQELTMTTRDLVPHVVARDVLVFDWWIRNDDRALTPLGGNVNLLWQPRPPVAANAIASSGLVVIDHNLAFDAAFSVKNFCSSHVFATDLAGAFSDFVLRGSYRERLAQAAACLPARTTICRPIGISSTLSKRLQPATLWKKSAPCCTARNTRISGRSTREHRLPLRSRAFHAVH